MSRREIIPRLSSLVLVSVLVLGLLAVVPGTAAASTSAEQDFVSRVNSARTAKGLGTLTLNPRLADVARGWSGWMASRSKLEHRPGLGSEVSAKVTDDWTNVGENVGYTTNAGGASQSTVVKRLHDAFMASSGHRANILGDYNQVGVGVVVAGNGTMWVTVNFMQAPVTATPQRQGTIPSFAGWRQFDAPGGVSAPAATSMRAGRTDVFAVDGRGGLVHRWLLPGTTTWAPSGDWRRLGHPDRVQLVGQPAVTTQRDGSLDVFARGSDDQLWHRAYRPGSGWSGWMARGGVLGTGPSAISWRDGHIAVFVTSKSGLVWERSWAGRWYDWRRVGGPVASAPGAVSWAPGRIDVFARGTDGALKHAFYLDGGWSGLRDRGGVLTAGPGRPDAVSWGNGRLDVFVVGGSTSGLYRTGYQDGAGWVPASGYSALSNPDAGGALDTGTASVSWGAGHLQVFAVDAAGRIHSRTSS